MVEESKKDPMHSLYQPRVITKESILTASPSQLEMLLPHVVLIKDPIVPAKFKPMCVFLLNFDAFDFLAQITIKANSCRSWILT
jgi:hypothetical protein